MSIWTMPTLQDPRIVVYDSPNRSPVMFADPAAAQKRMEVERQRAGIQQRMHGKQSVRFWGPDTCGCAVHMIGTEYSRPERKWVADLEMPYITQQEAQQVVDRYRREVYWPSGDTRTMVQPDAVACPHHWDLGFTDQLWHTIYAENVRKNTVQAIIQELHPELATSAYQWEYDDQRFLTVSLPGIDLSADYRQAIETAIYLQFTPDLVSLV